MEVFLTNRAGDLFLQLSITPSPSLKGNLREEDNLSTRDKWPVPNVSFVVQFYCMPCLLCTCLNHYTHKIREL